MLSLAVVVLGLVVLLGGTLAVLVMRKPERPPSWFLAVLHGVGALAGYGVLVVALAVDPPRGLTTGTQSFGLAGAVLLLLAMLLGILALALHLARKRMSGIAIGIHASVAVAGYVILAVYLLVG